jgi:hypothetical protein
MTMRIEKLNGDEFLRRVSVGRAEHDKIFRFLGDFGGK